jgi:hypothetical protein
MKKPVAFVIFIAVMLSVAQLYVYTTFAGQGGNDSEALEARLNALEHATSHLGKLYGVRGKWMVDQGQRVANLERFTNFTTGPTLAPTRATTCTSTGCGCSWANSDNCKTSNGSVCHKECCCKLTGDTEVLDELKSTGLPSSTSGSAVVVGVADNTNTNMAEGVKAMKCERVLGSLSCWTPLPAGTNASRCAVVVLANPAHRPLRALPAEVRTNALLKGLRMFMHNYNTRFTTAHHDMVIFHEDYTDCDMERVRQAVGPGSTVR